jgi:AcrR family transcriptional regulator
MPAGGEEAPNRDLREEVLRAAKGLFIERGYHALSMRAIAEAVGVTKAALYYHFKDKEALFLAMLVAYLEEMEATIGRIEGEEEAAPERVRRLVRAILAQPAEQRDLIRLASQEMASISGPARQAFDQAYHEKFIHRIAGMLEAGMQRGELRRLDPSVATWALLGMLYPYLYPAHDADLRPSGEAVEEVVSIYLQGVERNL